MPDPRDRYAEPLDPARPVVGFDESSKQRVAETRTPLPLPPGRPERFDTEFARTGTATLLLFVQPRGGWRHVAVTDRRTKDDFAHQRQVLVDRHVPDATMIRSVMDNLHTPTPAALDAAFPAAEAPGILRKLEFYSTPVHGSGLNRAELEFSLLSRQCLGRRMPDRETLSTGVAAWQAARNEQRATLTWQFTVEDARRKLYRRYPS